MVTCLLHNCKQISKLPLQRFVTSSSSKKVWWPNQKDFICWNKQTNDVSCKYLLSIFKMCYIATQKYFSFSWEFLLKGCSLLVVWSEGFFSVPTLLKAKCLPVNLVRNEIFSQKERENNFYGLDLCDLKQTFFFSFYQTLPILSFCFSNILNPDSLIALVTPSEL